MGYIDYSRPNYRYCSWGEDEEFDYDFDYEDRFVVDHNTGRRLRRWHETLYLKLSTSVRYDKIGVSFSMDQGKRDSYMCFAPEESIDTAIAYLAKEEREEDICIEEPVYFERVPDGEDGSGDDSFWQHIDRKPWLGAIMEGFSQRLIKVQYR